MENATARSPGFDLDIGVIYTHERQFMTPLVSSLARSGDGLQMRLIVVDNASGEGVEPWLGQFAHTKAICNAQRLSYASNMNSILAASTARYTLLLNTDMYFDPAEQCLAKMVAFMDAHPRCGIAGCRLYHRDGRYGYSARRFITLPSIMARRLGLGKVFASSLSHYLYLDRSPLDVFTCDWLSGCFMLVRREAIDDIGAVDIKFRKYFEDVDLCARMAQAGWQVLFNGQTFAYHFEQRASRQVLSRDCWQHLRSYLRWVGKWGIAPPQFPAVPSVHFRHELPVGSSIQQPHRHLPAPHLQAPIGASSMTPARPSDGEPRSVRAA
jgi:N-acetylglucosaminyl-diphospho-decaprenol L-rhamnosyltransferase